MKRTILVFAAHPDDEVLGCGGTIARYVSEGADVRIVILADGCSSRRLLETNSGSERLARKKAAQIAARILGAQSVIFGDFPDNRMDSLDLLDIVQFVERQIKQYSPEIVLTHYGSDLNIDHRLVHQAVVTACRPHPGHSVTTILFFEIASSTEWQPQASAFVFSPNWFVNITEYLEVRSCALEAYIEEMRPWPHARSLEAVEHLTRWRGATVGLEAVEAFMLGRMILK